MPFTPGGPYTTGVSQFTAANANNIETALTGLETVGEILLDDNTIPGNTAASTDEQRLTNCMSFAGQRTYPPFIVLGNRSHDFSTVARFPYDGFRIRGPGSPSNAEKGGLGRYNTALVNLGANQTWLTFPNNGTGNDNLKAFDMYVGGFAIRGTSTSQCFATAANVVLWCSQFDNLSVANVKSVFGSLTQAFVITGCQTTGVWDIGNCYSTSCTFAGSDSSLWVAGAALIDSGTGFSPAPGTFHVYMNFLNNSDIGAVYLTCQGPWAGMRIDGPAFNTGPLPSGQAGHLNFFGTRIEGKNANVPCDGALIRGSGAICNWFGAHLAHGMANPSSYTAAGHSPVDAGIVHLTGTGQWNFIGTEYDRTNTPPQAEQNPYLFYNNGARLRVSDVLLNATGGTWTGLPAAHTVSGTTVIDYGGPAPTVAAV